MKLGEILSVIDEYVLIRGNQGVPICSGKSSNISINANFEVLQVSNSDNGLTIRINAEV